MKNFTLSKKLITAISYVLIAGSLFGIYSANKNFSFDDLWDSRDVSLNMAPCPGLAYECRETVNLSLLNTCTATISADDILVSSLGLPKDTFIITVTDKVTGAAHANLFNSVDINKTFKVSISVKGCDNAPCWSFVKIEDKIGPVILCTNDTIKCNQPLSTAIAPLASDPCGIASITNTQTYAAIPCSDPNSALFVGCYTRIYTVTDLGGMTSSCAQKVFVERPNLAGIVTPGPLELNCSSFTGNFPPESVSGSLTLDGLPLTPSSEELCMATLSRKDSVISSPILCQKTIRRDWQLIQWTCGSPIIRKFTQIITVVDTEAPVLKPVDDFTVDITSGSCLWTGKLPTIVATDNCNQARIGYNFYYNGTISTTNGATVSLPAGFHSIVYDVTDGTCGNTARDSFHILVRDKVAPVALCKSTIVAITPNGIGLVTAKDIDNKSFDYCGSIKSIKIRRLESTCEFDTAWQDTVAYCCTDVGRTDLMVAIRVEDTSGNVNVCMAPVQVQNKIVPYGIYPDDTTVTCSFPIDFNNLGNSFGIGKLAGTACANTGTFEYGFDNQLDGCGTGTFRRFFSLRYLGTIIQRDTQVITVVQDTLLLASSVVWPLPEVTVQIGKTDTQFTGSPRWPSLPCNVIGLSISNDTIGTPSGGTCYKIFRRFKLLNWCGPRRNEIFTDFLQTIIVIDSIAPTITSKDTLRSVCSFADMCNNSREIVNLNATATDNGPVADLAWSFQIDLDKNGSIDTSGVGNNINYRARLGRHSVRFTVFDRCGSERSITYDFEVRNCKAPLPKCVSIVTRPMNDPDGTGPLVPMVEICAKTLDAKSEDVCSVYDSLRFTFDGAYPVISMLTQAHYFKGNGVLATLTEYNSGLAQRWDPVNRTSCKIFTCATGRDVTMTVWDTDFNKGECIVQVILEGCCTDIANPVIGTVVNSPVRILNNSSTCSGSVSHIIMATATDNIPIARLRWRLDIDKLNNGTIDSSASDIPNATVTTGFNVSLMAGLNKITLIVEDTCFNKDTLMYFVDVYNDRPPVPVCRTLPLTVNLVDSDGTGPMTPMAVISAIDLDGGSRDSCSSDALIYTFGTTNYPVAGSINSVHYFTGNGVASTISAFESGTAFRWNPTLRTAERKVSCTNLGTSNYTLTIWDADSRNASCMVPVTISGVCPCLDGTRPNITTLDTLRTFCNNTTNCNDSLIVTLSATATDVGSPLASLMWVYSLDFADNGINEFTGTGTGATITINPRSPAGTHRVTFIVSDTCQNRDTVSYRFTIKNCTPPLCSTRNVSVTTVDIDSTGPMLGMALLRADTFNVNSSDACTPQNMLRFTFSGAYPVRTSLEAVHFFKGNGLTATQAEFDAGQAQRWEPTLRTSVIKILCDGLTSRAMNMSVWDADTLQSTCSGTLTVLCNAAIGDYVWEDLNGDGRQDVGEPGIAGVTVTLRSADGSTVIRTAITDANGRYCLDNLVPAIYTVGFGTPSGYTPTLSNVGIVPDSLDSDPTTTGITGPYTIAINQVNKTVDAGFVRLAQLGNFVWNDANSNGRQDTGEVGIPNVRVVLQNANGVNVDSLLTDAQGMYCFTNVRPGSYRVIFRTPLNFSPTTSNASGVLDSLDSDPVAGITGSYTLLSNQINKTVDAGFTPAASACPANPYTGFIVATCNAVIGSFEPVAVMYDARSNASATRTANWNPTSIYGPNWTIDQIGQVFGVSTDDSANVYLAHSGVYLLDQDNPAGIPKGRIYKARPPLFQAVPFTTLPIGGTYTGDNRFNGIGNIVYDRKHNQLFATNLEDGKIYRISNTGVQLQTYDPFAADNGVAGIVAPGEQIWGIGINYEGTATKLYFARIDAAAGFRRLYSLQLTNTGALPTLINAEVIEANNLPGDEVRITDITFNQSGTRMLLAERGGVDKYHQSIPIIEGSHSSIAFELIRQSSSWVQGTIKNIGSNVKTEFKPDPVNVPVGIITGQNSAGGVAYGFEQVGTNPLANIDTLGWFSGNWLHKGSQYISNGTSLDDSLYYGAQAIRGNSTGNVKTDLVLDYNNNGREFGDKGQVGDLEVFRCLFTQPVAFASIEGEISTSNADMIENAEVKLRIGEDRDAMTNQSGKYVLSDVQAGKSYTVAPYKNDDVLNGVNVIDLLQLQRYILGLTKYDNPYTLLAADVNNDQRVTVADVVSLRKTILGVTDVFENNNSWRFFHTSSLPESNNPWNKQLIESFEISDLKGESKIDFVGLKVGDLDGSARANSAALQGRSSSKMISMVDQKINSGEIATIPVYYNGKSISAMHIKMNLQGVGLMGIENGQITIADQNVIMTRGNVQIIFAQGEEIKIDESKPLFYIKVSATSSEMISNMISLNPQSMVYSDLDGKYDLDLQLRDAKSSTETFILHQNIPNPWTNVTTIGIEVAKSGTAILTIFDINGKQVMNGTYPVEKGTNNIEINANDLNVGGVYHYTVKVGNAMQNKRFILLKR